MNQEKIGKFISKLRKEKNLTQQELADKLGVTDRAISKWENGRGLPDVSFYKQLCEILDISVNELINGEKINEDNALKSSDETIINALNINNENKKKSKNVIIFLLIILFCLVVIIFLIPRHNKKIYPNIDLYSIIVSLNDDEFYLEKKFTYDKQDVYYYGISSAQLCDSNENCYEMNLALNNNQINIKKIKSYLESQYTLGNVERFMFYDGGTTVFQNERYQVIFCNTLNGNKDIYIGESNMLENLEGNYCGKDKYETKSYIRTYEVLSTSVNSNDKEFMNVTLRQNNGNIGTVTIHNSNDLIPGKTYEFSFYTFDEFEDTIENIFKHSTLLKTIETDKNINEQINEEIYINKNFDNESDLNELEHVSMTIREGTLKRTGATIVITDYSGKNYIYGSPFRLDKKENGVWIELENICDNCAFNAMGYGVDKEGKLVMEQHWGRMYGSLENGTYRLVKDAFPKSDTPISEGYIPYYFSVEFIIE